MTTIDLPQGPVAYRAAGPADSTAPRVVFVHPVLMDGSLWDGVAERLASAGIASIAPHWPLGAHRQPLGPDADLSPRGVARLIVSFLEALDLDDVTLVGNDTGGALIQFVLDTDASRVGRVVLANCDAFDTFPPFPFSTVFRLLKGRTRLWFNLQPMRLRRFRHSPLGLGLLSDNLDPEQTAAWIAPCLESRDIRRDTVQFLRALDPDELLDVSTRLDRFDGPVTIVWGAADRAFRVDLGRRLQQAFGDARFVEVPGARTLLPLDAPDVLAAEIARLGAPTRGARSPRVSDAP
jgi:pimeloyl-ACP methyl ester carboxylesterase